jgi:hypothetical protein
MEKNYSEPTKRISADLRKLRKDIPDTMQAFRRSRGPRAMAHWTKRLSVWPSIWGPSLMYTVPALPADDRFFRLT